MLILGHILSDKWLRSLGFDMPVTLPVLLLCCSKLILFLRQHISKTDKTLKSLIAVACIYFRFEQRLFPTNDFRKKASVLVKERTTPKPTSTMMQTPQRVEKALGEQERTNFMVWQVCCSLAACPSVNFWLFCFGVNAVTISEQILELANSIQKINTCKTWLDRRNIDYTLEMHDRILTNYSPIISSCTVMLKTSMESSFLLFYSLLSLFWLK